MSGVGRYRKKPIVIEAVYHEGPFYKWLWDWLKEANALYLSDFSIEISTLEGAMTAQPGDYIIKGIQGEFYPCKADIFEDTYEEVEEGETE